MNRAERDAQDDFMYESAHRFRDVHDMGGEVSYTVYENKITCGEVLIFALVIGSLIIAAVVYFWK